MIKALIFDMGGVFILNKIKNTYLKLADYLGVEGNALAELVWSNRQKFMDGSFSTDDFCLLIKNQFKLQDVKVEDIAKKWEKAFLELLIVNMELYGIIDRLKKYDLGIISDAPPLHAKINREKGLYVPFKAVVISSEVGLVKPQKEIFELALKKLNLKAEECIFIDDAYDNIMAARSVGFKTVQFTDNNQLVRELKLLGVKL
jgi:epoxide hydrolase-like predicted phosphatase